MGGSTWKYAAFGASWSWLEKLYIEQSLLSRVIKALEDDLGAQFFARTTRSIRLTRAGQMLLEHVPRVFASLPQLQINHSLNLLRSSLNCWFIWGFRVMFAITKDLTADIFYDCISLRLAMETMLITFSDAFCVFLCAV